MPTMQETGAEAVCSALYNMPFVKFLGERPDPAGSGDVAWFRLSQNGDKDVPARQDPKQVLVAVYQEDGGLVTVAAHWLNLSGGTVLKAGQVFRVPTENTPDQQVRLAIEQVVLRVLGIYQDVLQQEGVAGDVEEALKPYTETDEIDDEEDEDVD